MTWKTRILQMITLGIKQFRDPYYQGFAAQLSFYFMLSMVPLIIIISQIVGSIFEESLYDAVGWLFSYLPNLPMTDEIKGFLTYNFAGGWNLLFAFIALWAASRAQFSMMRIANFTFTDGRSTGRGFWRERFRAVFNMIVTLGIILLAIVVLLYGGRLLEVLMADYLTDADISEMWLVIRWPLTLFLFFLMIVSNYYVLPTNKFKIKEIIPGSIFASLGLFLVTWVYSVYIKNIANYDILYGSLASIVALMFWFYFLAWVLCLGLLFNKVWKDTAASRK